MCSLLNRTFYVKNNENDLGRCAIQFLERNVQRKRGILLSESQNLQFQREEHSD